MIYLGKQAEIRYAAVGGLLFSVAVTSGNMAWLHYLAMQGQKLAGAFENGRYGAFLGHPNLYAVLLIGTFPMLLCFLQDKQEQLLQKTWVRCLTAAVLSLGFWSLWRTGSRGAMLGLFAGGIVTYFAVCFQQKKLKQFITVFTVCVAAAAVLLLAGIQGGETRRYDVMRLRLLRSSYAMWQDHKLLGVGLANWHKEYSTKYILKKEIEKYELQRYQEWKKVAEKRAEAARKAVAAKKTAQKAEALKADEQKNAASRKTPVKKQTLQKPEPQQAPGKKAAAAKKAAKREAARIAAWKKAAVEYETGLPMPHNVVAWFFSATGVIGAAGYLFFMGYYIWLFGKRMKVSSGAWVLMAGLWAFLAIGIHGLVDAGITNKAAARLLYMVMGIALGYRCLADRKKASETNDSAVGAMDK